VAFVLLASCGQGVSRESLTASFAEANPEASASQAECVVDRLLTSYDLESMEAELVVEELDPGFEESQFRAMFACGVVGDVGDQITEQLEASGVSTNDAPCVSDQLVEQLTDEDIDVLLSGEITDQFYAKFFTAMEACDAVD